MNLTPEQRELGRRNFLRALAGVPAVVALGATAFVKGPVPGGPVRLGLVGVGRQGRLLLEQIDPRFGEVVAVCDINPLQLQRAGEVLNKGERPSVRHYEDWREMMAKEELEALVVATPLFLHAEITVAALDAGLHALCENMMAWDLEGCLLMRDAARRNERLLEIGHQRHYNPLYQAAYEGIIQAGLLGEVYHSHLAWHQDGSWRRDVQSPGPGFDPSRWGYPDLERLYNWRLYEQYSRGLLAERASHQVAVANWFWEATPEVVIGSGGVHRYRDGREVPDHVYVTFEYPEGRTALFSSIQSNAFDGHFEAFYGTEGTLILEGEREAYLFPTDERTAGIETVPRGAGPVSAASESQTGEAAAGSWTGGVAPQERASAYEREISGFCAAIRTGLPLRCGPDLAMGSARACIAAWDAVENSARVAVPAAV
jgi:predicted dehydrogenase